jgi:hypothetical protein
MKQLFVWLVLLAGTVCDPVIGLAEQSSNTNNPSASEAEATFWVTSTGKRHKSTCRFFGKTKDGHYTTNKDEGSPCKICGG